MAKAKKLPSGNWRVQLYTGKDPATGKRKYESFTAATRKEAEYLAAEYQMDQNERQQIKNWTVKEGIEAYIKSKDNILSPSTVREYKRSAERDLRSMHHVKYADLSNAIIQGAINAESETHSAKSVKNMSYLLIASLKMFYPDFNVRISYPQKKKTEYHIPTDTEIKTLIKHVEGSDIEIPILLAACGSLRRSEICPLLKSDITDMGVRVTKAMVQDENKNWVIKTTKTTAGHRFTPMPPEIIRKLKSCDEQITKLNQNQIYKRFRKALVECGVSDFRFHDLRHYYASVSHALGVPDKYIMQYGGWSSDGVLKNVYQHVLSERAEGEGAKVVDFFEPCHLDQN